MIIQGLRTLLLYLTSQKHTDSGSKFIDASMVLECAGRDGELARVLFALASLAPDASRKIMGGSLGALPLVLLVNTCSNLLGNSAPVDM